MITFENELFEGLYLDEDAKPIENMEFVGCRFESCFSAPRKDFANPAVLRNLRIRSCSYQSCDLFTAFLDEVEIDGMTRSGRHPAFTWGSRFRHVTLRGTVGPPLIRPLPDPELAIDSPQAAELWRSELARFYSEVDWALDITQARFTTFVTFFGVPADSVRINPEHQVIVEREMVLSPDFRYQELHSLAQIVVDRLVKEGHHDVVVAAGIGGRKTKEHLTALELLRSSGATRPGS